MLKYRVMLGKFPLGWIVLTGRTARYSSSINPIGDNAETLSEAQAFFQKNLPMECRCHITLERQN